ncbi:MAG TPA: histidine kinase [Legionella sp.]|nr:histidine kinase [Legionella sp.]
MFSFSSWFQLGATPVNEITGHYNDGLVVLSYVVAVLASYVALNFVGRLRAERNHHFKIYWLLGGAFTMGAGIWSMHFIGMLAFVMPMHMGFDFSWTAASLVMAILASGFALFILQEKSYSIVQLAIGGIIIGLAISTMHYMGMEGMKSQMAIHYLPGLFFLSVVIGVGAAEAALWLALQSNKGSNKRQSTLRIISALVMGVAICGIHYTGMSAAVFTPNMLHAMTPSTQTIQPEYLAFFVAGITALIISLALTVSSYYKKMVVAVENEKNFLNAMLDNLDDGIIACDDQGQMTVLNHTLQKHIEFKDNKNMDDLLGYFSLYTMDNQAISLDDFPLKRALRGERIRGLQLIMRFKNNVTRDVVVDGQKIMGSSGNVLGAVAVIHDITELKNTERLKNEFVSIVSHELRTPLTSIRGSLGLLVSGMMGDFPDKAKKLIAIANNNCERLLLLINDLLDIEKIEAGKMDFQLNQVDLNQVVKESTDANKMYADRFGVFIQFIPSESNIQVLVDASRLMQVLTNLISNACKFSPKGDEIIVSVAQINSTARVSISDHGPGISPEFRTRIFQKFSQADSSATRGKGGTGLGLNISKIIIEKLGGVLDFNSQENKGTTFYFDLPVSDANSAPIIDSLTAIHDTKRRLLLCEDDKDQSDYLKLLLESAGFFVDVASTVAEAKKHLSLSQYKALLLDLILPDQDGIAFIRELRAAEKTAHLPIIVISMIAQTGRALLSGDAVSVVDWLDKPIDFNQLLTSINRMKKKNTTGTPQILHIEDNVDMQHVVEVLLEKHAVVDVAHSLQKAKQMLEEKSYDLVILDLLLPDGNGIEILPLLAKYRSPVLVFSNMQLNADYAKFVSQALIKSNSSNETLLNTIKNLL